MPPRSQLTKEQRDGFIEALREGMNRAQAAAHVGATGSRFRSLCRRDEAFAALVEEVCAEGRDNFHDTLRQEWRQRAQKNDRLFQLELITHLPELQWKRTAGRVAITQEDDVKQRVDVAIEAVLDELAARREAKAARRGPTDIVAGDSEEGAATT